MAAIGIQWDVTPVQALTELADVYISAIHKGIFAIAQKYAPLIENWMRDNAPWTDRTANARQSLWTQVTNIANEMVFVILSHGVGYGIYLEMNNAGKFAIINPALDHFAPLIWADVARMLS